MAVKKILLMGSRQSGKTSIKSIIFSGETAEQTKRLDSTSEIEESHVKLYANILLNIWDCGGPETCGNDYFSGEKERIFRNVDALIFVIDVNKKDHKTDLEYYESCVKAIHEHSPAAKVFCLIHKSDLLEADKKNETFLKLQNEINNKSDGCVKCTCFMTSIKNETLYRAWSSIVSYFITNIREIEESLKKFADVIECDDIILFHRTTFVIMSFCERNKHNDPTRFEKISVILSNFKKKCLKHKIDFTFIEVKNNNFAAFINLFTSNTYMMIVMPDKYTTSAAVQLNIRYAQKHFKHFDSSDDEKVPGNMNTNTSSSSSTNSCSSTSTSSNQSVCTDARSSACTTVSSASTCINSSDSSCYTSSLDTSVSTSLCISSCTSVCTDSTTSVCTSSNTSVNTITSSSTSVDIIASLSTNDI